MLCSVVERGMTSLSFQTAMQKSKAKLSPSVQIGYEMVALLCSMTEWGGAPHAFVAF